MKSETLYKKVGRRYVPVMEEEPPQSIYRPTDRWPPGFHLTYCEPGHRLNRFDINPDTAQIQAALLIIQDNISKIVYDAHQAKEPTKLTKKQREIWQSLIDSGAANYLEFESAAGVAAKILDEITKLVGEKSAKS
jgi:hypothetical protein